MVVRVALVALEIGPARAFQRLLDLWQESDIEATVFTAVETAPVLGGHVLDRQGSAEVVDVASHHVVAMSASGYPLEGDIRRRCQMLNVPVFQFVDQWYNYALRFSTGTDPRWPNRIGLIDRYSFDEAVKEGLPPDRLVAVGSPVWEAEPPLSRANRADIAFFGQPVARDYGRSLGYDEWDVWSVVKQVTTERPDLIRKVIYCPHPSLSDVSVERIAPARLARDAEEALLGCGTVISMFSSPMISAYLRGRHVISLQPGLRGVDRGMLSRRGHIPCVEDAQGLIRALEQSSPPSGNLALDLRHSTRRMSDAILGLAPS